MNEKKKVVSLLKFFLTEVDGCLQHLQKRLPEGELFSLAKFENDNGNAIVKKIIDILQLNELIKDLGFEDWEKKGRNTFNENQKISKDMFKWD